MTRSQWPPSPRVEDEELALKNEIKQHTGVESKTEAEEARCRGTVDQYPIILDTNLAAESKHGYTSSTDNEGESSRTHSSDDSFGPPTPPNCKASRKDGEFRSNSPGSRSWSGKATASSNTSKQPNEGVNARGRPHMPRIQTDIGSDLQGMITGERRAPSPYAYTKPEVFHKQETHKRVSGHTFLSPGNTAPVHAFPAADSNKRSSSALPASKPTSDNPADDSSDNERRSWHHSRRRPTRDTFSRAGSPPANGPKEGDALYAYRQSRKGGQSKKEFDAVAPKIIDANEFQGKRLSKESPCTSSAEDSWSKSRSDFVARSDKPLSKGSPHTSSTEEGRPHRGEPIGPKAPERRSSHRGSVSRKERPRLDLSGHQYSYHGAPSEERQSSTKFAQHGDPTFEGRSYLGSAPVRSPKVMEERLEKAFKDSRGRCGKGSATPSTSASSCGSPPRDPPRTPRVDRRSKDYFSLGISVPPATETMRPRAVSQADGQHPQSKLPVGAMAAAAGPRLSPALSRSSTLSAELHPGSNNSGKPASGRKSRNSSPVPEPRAPVSRAGREHEKVIPKLMRDEERPNERPVSRTGTKSYNQPPVASPFERFDTRSGGTYPAPPVDALRINQRASSYSAADDPQHLRQPSSAKSSQLHFAPPLTANQAPYASTARLPGSPSLSERGFQPHQSAELPPCPRSLPVAGLYDWYTVVGMPELDICPSCMTALGASRFRDMFVPSTSKVPGQEVLCDFSRPWVRTAWTQIIKQRRSSLEMLYLIVYNSGTTRPCPGRRSDVRAWYRLPDPETGSNVPNFDACSECVRSIEIIFPQLRGVFKRGGALVQERTCDLTPQSRRFHNYLGLLEAAALRYDVERFREPNIQAFANYARKSARVRECPRDDMVMGQPWHFIPGLPEFTICEECFEQVVWPVADKPVASSVNRTLQLVPGTQRNTGISCQLYSEKMRKRFLEAVRYADFEFLRQVALRRYGIERLLQEKHKLLMKDMSMGKDRAMELQANIEEWRKWE